MKRWILPLLALLLPLTAAAQLSSQQVAEIASHLGTDRISLHYACTLINIRFLDHIIIAKDGYYSFRQSGFLE